jgi:hypothetical protein
MEPNEETNFKANWQAKKGGHTREEAGQATKRKSNHAAHQGGGTRSPQVLTADEEVDFKANWQAKKGGYPSGKAGWATKRKADHVAHQGGGTRSLHVSTVLFGSTAGENQGKTGQGGSTANFLPAPRKAGDPHAEAWLAWLQARRDRKEATHAAAQRKTNHAAHQGGGMRTPQVLMALSSSTVGKKQGKTGQGVSAANF